MNADGREIALIQQFVHFIGTSNGLDKDADLVELQGIQQVNELPVLFILLQLDVVLAQTVQRQLRGFFMNFLHTSLTSLERVAENIITCFSWGVALKISCTSLRMSRGSSILSHSSRMKHLTFFRESVFSLTKAQTRPGVATMMLGMQALSSSRCCFRFTPPYTSSTLTKTWSIHS